MAHAIKATQGYDPEQLAVFYVGAGEQHLAGEQFLVAADNASESLAFEHAASLYQKTLELLPHEGQDRKTLLTKLANALSNAGHGHSAAIQYQSAAKLASGQESLELLGRAGFELCASGHIDEGRDVLTRVMSHLGMKIPKTRMKALLSMIWHRARVMLRGTNFQERDESQVAPHELMRIDISWSTACGLTMIDTIRGADFQTRNLLLALPAGEPRRIARALAWEATHEAMAGSKRSLKMLDKADLLAEKLAEPFHLGMAKMGRGVSAYFLGQWRQGNSICDEAIEIFRNGCTGVTWELDTSSAFAFWSLWWAGNWTEMSRRFPDLVREATARGDRLAVANYTTFGGPFVWLCRDDPQSATHALEDAMGDWSKQDFHVQHFTQLSAQVEIAMYSGDAKKAWQILQRDWPAMKASALLHVQCVRIYMLHLRARCALAAALADPQHAEKLVAVAAKDARKIEKEKPEWCRALAAMIRAAIARRRGDSETAAKIFANAADQAALAGMEHFEAAATLRAGELASGASGDSMIEQAHEMMRNNAISHVEKMANLLAPS